MASQQKDEWFHYIQKKLPYPQSSSQHLIQTEI